MCCLRKRQSYLDITASKLRKTRLICSVFLGLSRVKGQDSTSICVEGSVGTTSGGLGAELD